MLFNFIIIFFILWIIWPFTKLCLYFIFILFYKLFEPFTKL